MTTNEIKDLIASAIAGQGNQVDSGGKLAEILNAIVEMAGQGGGGGASVIEITEELTGGNHTEEELAAIGLTWDEMIAACEGKRFGLLERGSYEGEPYCYLSPITHATNEGGSIVLCFAAVTYDDRGDIMGELGYEIRGSQGGTFEVIRSQKK